MRITENSPRLVLCAFFGKMCAFFGKKYSKCVPSLVKTRCEPYSIKGNFSLKIY